MSGQIRSIGGPFVDVLTSFLNHAAPIATLAITQTIESQTDLALVRVVNRKADEQHIRAHAFRKSLVQKAEQKLYELKRRLTRVETEGLPLSEIRVFYERLERQKPAVFQAIRRFKKRQSLYPDEEDMRILAEAADIARTHARTFLLSADYDFIAFIPAIWTTFHVCVIPLRWAPINQPEVANLIQNPCPDRPLPDELKRAIREAR